MIFSKKPVVLKISLCLFFTAYLILVTPLQSQPPKNFDASNSASCTTQGINTLRRHIQLHQGVEGTNPSAAARYIGTQPAYHGAWRTFVGKNWYPLHEYKLIMCGNLDRFGTYDGIGDEMDWNIFVSPDQEFYQEHVLPSRSYATTHPHDIFNLAPTDWHTLSNGRIQVEGEITPDEHLYGFPWFPKGSSSPLVNRKICLYGPFVREEVHGNRPEIHPCEQIWWRDELEAYYLLSLIDDSNRFNDPQDFGYNTPINGQIRNPTPPGWKPWTIEDGQNSAFRIAFELNPRKEKHAYRLNVLDFREFNDDKTYEDSDDGIEHAITYNGRVVLTITEPGEFDHKVGITFQEVCYNWQDNKLQGYIEIKSSIGNGSRKEGLVLFRVDKDAATIGERNAQFWEYGGLQPFQEWKEDPDQVALGDIVATNFNGRGNVDGFIDFDADGKVDLFTQRSDGWYVYYNNGSAWTRINTINTPIDQLKFGDFDGDRKTDVITAIGRQWYISYGGTSGWQKVGSSQYNFANMRVGDFDGDGKTDIFSNDYKINTFRYSPGANKSWRNLTTPYFPYRGGKPALYKMPMDQFRFGDFNGDGKTDVFVIDHGYSGSNKDTWWISWGGASDWKKLRKDELVAPLNDLIFANFGSGNTTDILYIQHRDQWRFSYNANTDWDLYYGQKLDRLNTLFLDYNADGSYEAMRAKRKAVKVVPAIDYEVATIPPQKMAVKGQYTAQSLKRVSVGGQSVLAMDVDLDFYGAKDNTEILDPSAAPPLEISQVTNLSTGQSLNLTQSDNEQTPNRAIINLVNIFGEDPVPLEITLINGKKSTIKLPVFTVSTLPLQESVLESKDKSLSSVVQDLQSIALVENNLASLHLPTDITFIQEYELALIPAYYPIRNGQIEYGEDSPVVEDLNAAIATSNEAEIKNYFGTATPLQVDWSFEAFDLIKQEAVTVKTSGQPSTEEIGVSIDDSAYLKWKLNFFFPDDHRFYLVKAKAKIADTYGNKNERTYAVANYQMKFDSLQLEKFIAENATNDNMLKVIATSFADDSVLSFEELLLLTRAHAKSVRNQATFSFKEDFAEAWNEFQQPNLEEFTPRYYPVLFEVLQNSFPATLSALEVENIAIHFVTDNGLPPMAVELNIGEKANTNRMTYNGKVNTWSGENQERWENILNQSPIGLWNLAVPNNDTVWGWFQDGKIKDIRLTIYYRATMKQ